MRQFLSTYLFYKCKITCVILCACKHMLVIFVCWCRRGCLNIYFRGPYSHKHTLTVERTLAGRIKPLRRSELLNRILVLNLNSKYFQHNHRFRFVSFDINIARWHQLDYGFLLNRSIQQRRLFNLLFALRAFNLSVSSKPQSRLQLLTAKCPLEKEFRLLVFSCSLCSPFCSVRNETISG